MAVVADLRSQLTDPADGRSGLMPVLGDVVFTLFIAGVLLGASANAAADQSPPARPLDAFAYVLLVLLSVTIPLRRRARLTMLAVTSTLLAIYLGFGYAHGPAFLPVAVAGYFVGLHHDRPTAGRAGKISVMVVLVGAVIAMSRGDSYGGWKFVVATIPIVAVCSVPILVGALIRLSRLASAQAEEEAMRRRIEQERLRMAREVHDVVGHSLSIISLQAAVALHVLDRRPEQAQVALNAIRRTSVDALDELRATLALTRAGQRAASTGPSPDGPASTGPSPDGPASTSPASDGPDSDGPASTTPAPTSPGVDAPGPDGRALDGSGPGGAVPDVREPDAPAWCPDRAAGSGDRAPAATVGASGRAGGDIRPGLMARIRAAAGPDALVMTLGLDDLPRTPLTGLRRLPTLLSEVRLCGVPIELVTGDAAADRLMDLPADLDLAAYRIVQESLTNVLRHTEPAQVQVQVAREIIDGWLIVDVTDRLRPRRIVSTAIGDGDGANGHRPADDLSGHGLTGLRERAAELGGHLTAGPVGVGCWRVRAELPMPPGSRHSVIMAADRG